MNIFFAIILFALIFEYLLDMIANFLNLKSIKSVVPEDLSGIYEPDEYRKSQDYLRTTTKFAFLTNTFKLILLLGFWFAGGFGWLDEAIREQNFHIIINGLLFISILLLAQLVLTIPFEIYSTFVIEDRFGFNKTTPSTFAYDRVKGLLILLIIGGPLIAGILSFFEYAGSLAWVYCWIAVTLFSLGLQFIAPTWIMPIFNKFTPLEKGNLRDSIFEYANTVNFSIDNILLMDGSKRSNKANAFFTGFGKHKRIALFDTLIEKHSVSELVSIIGHEIGHYKKGHIIQRLVFSIIHSGVIFFLLSIFLNSTELYDAFFVDEQSVYAGLLFFGLLYTPIEIILGPIMQGLSRKHEYEADLWAVDTVNDHENLSNGLKKLSVDNLSNLTPHPLYVFLNYSHPPLLKRLQAIELRASK